MTAETVARFDFAVEDPDSGVTYHPWTDGHAIGFKAELPNGEVRFVYLNPSGGSDDGVATVFPYEGAEGDPSQDRGACGHHFVVFDPQPNGTD